MKIITLDLITIFGTKKQNNVRNVLYILGCQMIGKNVSKIIVIQSKSLSLMVPAWTVPHLPDLRMRELNVDLTRMTNAMRGKDFKRMDHAFIVKITFVKLVIFKIIININLRNFYTFTLIIF